MFVDVKSENCLAVACLEKKTENFVGINQNKRNKLFSNIAYFETSKNCSNQTKIDMAVKNYL